MSSRVSAIQKIRQLPTIKIFTNPQFEVNILLQLRCYYDIFKGLHYAL